MRKWIIPFLVLVNGIVFLYFTMQYKTNNDSGVGVNQIRELRLVSEMSPEILIKRDQVQPANAVKRLSDSVNGECYFYSNIQKTKDREAILSFFNEKGLTPVEYLNNRSGWRLAVFLSSAFSRSDEKMIKKINRLLKNEYFSIKIEKKCVKGLRPSRALGSICATSLRPV